jgi:hypothetical protein
MTRIVEHRQDASPGEEIFELRVFQSPKGEVRACVIPADMTLDHAMMEEMSEPADQAFLDALALCEKEEIAVLWIHDPLGLFPPRDRPVREM